MLQGPKGDMGLPGVQGPPGLKVWPDQTNEIYTLAFLSFCISFCVYVQGEKGEPGFVIAADGSIMSGLAGPLGPRGDKVVFVFCILTS